MQFFSTTCSLDSLTSVCFYKFMRSNHLILFCSNKTVSGVIIAGKNCNKVYMLTGLCPGTAEKGRQLHKHSKCQQSCLWDFQLFVLRRLQADRVNYLWQNSPLLPLPKKKKGKHEGEVFICEIVKVEKSYYSKYWTRMWGTSPPISFVALLR